MKNFYNVAQLCLLAPVLVGSQSQYTYNYNQVRPVRRLESGLIHKKKRTKNRFWRYLLGLLGDFEAVIIF